MFKENGIPEICLLVISTVPYASVTPANVIIPDAFGNPCSAKVLKLFRHEAIGMLRRVNEIPP